MTIKPDFTTYLQVVIDLLVLLPPSKALKKEIVWVEQFIFKKEQLNLILKFQILLIFVVEYSLFTYYYWMIFSFLILYSQC